MLCDYLTKQDEENGEQDRQDRPLFDIIAGTSIGAINAAILVSHVIEKRKTNPGITQKDIWEGSAENLVNFWNYLSQPTPDISKLSDNWKINKNEPTAALEEEARRYYSAKEFLTSGVKKVFLKEDKIDDNRFYDNPFNSWVRYNNQRLRDSIGSFAHFPIASDFDKEEPRLLVVSVDVVEGATVTFDSYGKPNTTRRSQYGYNEKTKKYEYTIEYPQGITLKHIMASAAVLGMFISSPLLVVQSASGNGDMTMARKTTINTTTTTATITTTTTNTATLAEREQEDSRKKEEQDINDISSNSTITTVTNPGELRFDTYLCFFIWKKAEHFYSFSSTYH